MFSFAFQNLSGLTLNAKLFDSAGAQTGATITSGFADIGDGAYQYLATIPDGHVGTLKIYDSAQPSRCIPLAVNPQEIENANVRISDLNNLSQSQAQTAASAALTAYGAATATNVSSAQTAITNAIAALNDLSDSDIVAALQAMDIETGHSFLVVMRALYALFRNNSEADDPTNPTTADYYAPDGVTVRVHHDLTPTTRTVA